MMSKYSPATDVPSVRQPSFLMPLKGVLILPDLIALNRMAGGRRSANSKLIHLQETILAEASGLVEPVAIWARLDIKHASLLPGKLAGMLSGVEAVIGAVCTIGEKLEIQSRQYFAEQEYTRGYLLDQVGTLSVATLAQKVAESLRRQHHGVHWAPGDDAGDLALDAQRLLFDTVPAHRIGVRLTEQNVMTPLKSLSFILVMGANAGSLRCSIPCTRCTWDGMCDKRLQQVLTIDT